VANPKQPWSAIAGAGLFGGREGNALPRAIYCADSSLCLADIGLLRSMGSRDLAFCLP